MINRQPLLHDAVLAICAPTQTWSAADGEIGEQPIHGVYHSDIRVLSRLSVRVGGRRAEGISHSSPDATTVRFVSLLRDLDDDSADPKVRLDTVRRVTAGRLSETLTISSALPEPIAIELTASLDVDFSPMHLVKAGAPVPAAEVTVSRVPEGVRWRAHSLTATIEASGCAIEAERSGALLRWSVTVPPGGSAGVAWTLTMTDGQAAVAGAPGAPPWDGLPDIADPRLARWARAALDDLSALRMTAQRVPGESFVAAGAPWFFTLFGRDSIWAARFLLPLGTGLAASTLRVLAALQGTRAVAETAEQPGKIMHELRSVGTEIPGEAVRLPPLYYGTIDATPLWVCLLHDAWRAGMPEAEVESLLPNLEAALCWMRDYGDSDGDGLLEYIDATGHGLANQGWKDSGDSIQWRDGTLAEGPIALCEVQGYAYEAAIGGAELLEHFGHDGGAWRSWAAALADRFAESFWVDSPRGRYPAIALDARKRRVDAVTSNMGHLLGTGILRPGESALIAQRLVSPALNSGYGLRTLSADAAGYWPLSYHGGAVWTHDTAIAILGLSHEGHHAEAAQLVEGLLAAASAFGYRMPELYSGEGAAEVSAPVPYPAACRPQAWSAAAAIAVLGAVQGDVARR